MIADRFAKMMGRSSRVVLAAGAALVLASCTRVTAPTAIVQEGSFTLTLHLTTDSVITGVAEFNNDHSSGVPTFLIKFLSSQPEFSMDIFQEGTRPNPGQYEVYNEPIEGAFLGFFRVGSELDGLEFELVSGRLEITNSNQNQISGGLEIDAIQLNGDAAGRRVNISGIYRAPCFVNCPPSTGGPPS